MQGPETYLNELGVALHCVVNPSRPAVIDLAHRALVNYEAYFFSDEAALETFGGQPYRYTGWLTDPVTFERFVPNEDSPERLYGGRLFLFSSERTWAVFDRNPARFGVLMPGMREKQPARG